MTARLSRSQLFSHGARGGAALWLTGAGAAAFAGPAAADTTPDADLAYARLLVGFELLAADFYARALAARRLGVDESRSSRRALANERQHYGMLAGTLTAANQVPATPADFDFSYPKRAFASKASIARLGIRVEAASLGAYLGAVDGLQTGELRRTTARIAASEAEHLSLFRRVSGADPIGAALPRPLTVEQASGFLDSFTS